MKSTTSLKPSSARCASTTSNTASSTSRNGWLGGTVKPDWPILVNLRLDPYERTGLSGSLAFYNWYVYEFWRFVFVKDEIGKEAQSFLDFPPMQKGASF